jgi:hypothetical protein
LAGGNGIETLDALRDVSIGDGFDLQHVQFAEIGDLVERQGGVFDQPYGGRFRH